MVGAAVAGAGCGLGVLIVVRALRPVTPPLAAVLGRLDADAPVRSGRVAQRLLGAVGAGVDDTPDLRIVGRTADTHATAKLAAATLAAALVVTAGGLAAMVGFGPGVGMVPVLAAGAAAAGFVWPDLRVREDAARRRQAFRHALSAYLDLVNVILAGGGGLDSALHAAAEAGDGPAFAELRHALARARLTNRSPWDVFAELGARLDVHELRELAASVSLAGSHGARIRSSLAAKADALRGHQQAEIEAQAESATERMTIPVAVLLFGFLVFIAYPALVQITSITQSP